MRAYVYEENTDKHALISQQEELQVYIYYHPNIQNSQNNSINESKFKYNYRFIFTTLPDICNGSFGNFEAIIYEETPKINIIKWITSNGGIYCGYIHQLAGNMFIQESTEVFKF